MTVTPAPATATSLPSAGIPPRGTLTGLDRDWELLDDEQLDSGDGSLPDHVSGRGSARKRLGDATVEYLDDAGGRLTLHPADAPRTSGNDTAYCD